MSKKLKFVATERRSAYIGTVSFGDGQVKELGDELAVRLLKDFPDNFSEVKAAPKEKSTRTARDKSMRSSRNK